jgi:DNA (cytosine-5)-methyltransferase 1
MNGGQDVDTEQRLTELALFAGGGGGLLASQLLGHRVICAVEIEEYARGVLVARQNDGTLEPFPVWDDVCTFDGLPWRGRVDVISGGFPCQDISVAGSGAGIDGEKSGLWSEFVRIIREVQPRFVFVENSPALTSRGLGRVLGDLAALGFDAEWAVLGARDAGAHHDRDRIWILAGRPGDSEGRERVAERRRVVAGNDLLHQRRYGRRDPSRERGYLPLSEGDGSALAAADAHEERFQEYGLSWSPSQAQRATGRTGPWSTEPRVDRVDTGMAHRVQRLAALGNGQVSAVAALAWRVLSERMTEAQ